MFSCFYEKSKTQKIILDAEQVYILEVNTIPGLYEGSNFVYSAEIEGMDFYGSILWILNNIKKNSLWGE